MDHKNITFKKMNGESTSLKDFKGSVLMIVNVASKCGLTPQYKQLQALYEKYKDRGLIVLGFPANNFLNQEPGTDDEIKQFCELNYGVTFPVFSKISVKGADQHPLYSALTKTKPKAHAKALSGLAQKLKEKGLFGEPGEILWNFEKFLIDKEGEVTHRFAPDVKPDDPAIIEAIESLL